MTTREELLEYQITEATSTPEQAVALIQRYKAEVREELFADLEKWYRDGHGQGCCSVLDWLLIKRAEK